MTSEKKATAPIYNKIKRAALILVVSVIVVFSLCVGMKNYSKAGAYNRGTSDVSSKCSEVQNEIDEKEKLINGEGFDSYCEKIAREKYGYAKPGEHVIYDSSYGN